MKNNKVFKVIIAGGRDFNDLPLLKIKMDKLLESKIKEGHEIIVISGTARGADTLGEVYAKQRGYKVLRFPADWSLGKRAGYLRNMQMSEEGDALVAFWNGSKGTGHMIDIMKNAGKPYRIVNY